MADLPVIGSTPTEAHTFPTKVASIGWLNLSNLGLPSAQRVLDQYPLRVRSPLLDMFSVSKRFGADPSALDWQGSSFRMEASASPLMSLNKFSIWTAFGFFLIDKRDKLALGRVLRKEVDSDMALTVGATLDGKRPGFMLAVESNFFCPFSVLAWDSAGHHVYKQVYEDIRLAMETFSNSLNPRARDSYLRMLHLNVRDILRIDGANGFPSAISAELPRDDTQRSQLALEYSCDYLAPPFMLNPRCQPLNERESLAVLLGMALHPWINNAPTMAQPARLMRRFLTDPPNTRGHDFFELLNTAGSSLLKHVCATLTADPESKENALGTWMACAMRTL